MCLFKKKKEKKNYHYFSEKYIVKTRQKERNERNHANSLTFKGVVLDSH